MVCQADVRSGQKALECTMVPWWCHQQCPSTKQVNIRTSLYVAHCEPDDDQPWFCPVCNPLIPTILATFAELKAYKVEMEAKSGKNRVKTRNPIPHGDGRVGCLFKTFRDLCCLRPLSPYVTPELPVSIKNPSTPPPLAAPTANKPQNTTFYRPSFPSTTQTGNETMDTRKPTKRLRLTRIYSLITEHPSPRHRFWATSKQLTEPARLLKRLEGPTGGKISCA